MTDIHHAPAVPRFRSARLAYRHEIAMMKSALLACDEKAALRHVVRAHILGQRYLIPHLTSHAWMMRMAWKRGTQSMQWDNFDGFCSPSRMAHRLGSGRQSGTDQCEPASSGTHVARLGGLLCERQHLATRTSKAGATGPRRASEFLLHSLAGRAPCRPHRL